MIDEFEYIEFDNPEQVKSALLESLDEHISQVKKAVEEHREEYAMHLLLYVALSFALITVAATRKGNPIHELYAIIQQHIDQIAEYIRYIPDKNDPRANN